MRKPRILVAQQGCLPIYRKSFFGRLNALGSIDYVVAHGDAPRGTNLILAPLPYDFPNLPVKNREFSFFGVDFVWQQPLFWRALRGEFDGAVFGDEVKFLSSLAAIAVLRLQRKPVLLWGFGFHQNKGSNRGTARAAARVAALYKRVLYRLVSGYLAYTEGGREALRQLPGSPRRIVVLRNTIDTEQEARLRATVAGEPLGQVARQLGVRDDSIKLLYFGRFLPAKRLDLLVGYARRAAEAGRAVDVLLFGQGSEEGSLRAAASGLDNVVFHRHDDLLLARALRVSAAVVIPGFVGLAINHSFAHGVPVLTRAGQPHSPEVEYLEDGVNGLVLPEEPAAFFRCLDEFVGDREVRDRLAAGAESTALTIDMTHMVATFHALVAECLGRAGPGTRAGKAAESG